MRRPFIFSSLLILAIVSGSKLANAQSAIENKMVGSEVKPVEYKLLADLVINKFTEEIVLTTEQRPVFVDIINGYIDEKLKIMPLLSTNRIDYDAKQASYFSTLRAKLGNILLRPQLKKFMQLKPKASEQECSLYYIYY